jgi:hypothetical protein
VADHICETLFLQDTRIEAVTVKIVKLAIAEGRREDRHDAATALSAARGAADFHAAPAGSGAGFSGGRPHPSRLAAGGGAGAGARMRRAA